MTPSTLGLAILLAVPIHKVRAHLRSRSIAALMSSGVRHPRTLGGRTSGPPELELQPAAASPANAPSQPPTVRWLHAVSEPPVPSLTAPSFTPADQRRQDMQHDYSRSCCDTEVEL